METADCVSDCSCCNKIPTKAAYRESGLFRQSVRVQSIVVGMGQGQGSQTAGCPAATATKRGQANACACLFLLNKYGISAHETVPSAFRASLQLTSFGNTLVDTPRAVFPW